MKVEEIRDLIEDLDTIGHAQLLSMSISVGLNSNEFIMTNISEFISHRRKECEGKGIQMELISQISFSDRISERDKNFYSLILKGISWKIREFYDEVLKWNWIDPNKTFIEFEEIIG